MRSTTMTACGGGPPSTITKVCLSRRLGEIVVKRVSDDRGGRAAFVWIAHKFVGTPRFYEIRQCSTPHAAKRLAYV